MGKVIKHTKFGEVQAVNFETINLFQKGKKYVFVTDIERFGSLIEQKTGMKFCYEIAKDCNYFYRFWLEEKPTELQKTN